MSKVTKQLIWPMKSDTAQRNEILNSNITSKLPFKAWKMSLTSFRMGGVGLLSKRVWRPGRMLARAEHSCVSAFVLWQTDCCSRYTVSLQQKRCSFLFADSLIRKRTDVPPLALKQKSPLWWSVLLVLAVVIFPYIVSACCHEGNRKTNTRFLMIFKAKENKNKRKWIKKMHYF